MTQQELLEIIEQAAAEGWEELDLSDKGLTELPPEIGKLTKLKSLDLSSERWWEKENGDKNQLTELPPEIGKLSNLTKLNLQGNQFAEFSSEICKLVALTGLDLSGNQLSVLPPELGKLTNLTDLDLSDNQLIALPAELDRLLKLEKLWLRGNQLNPIPPEIFSLPRLTNLNLRSNQLSVIHLKPLGRLSQLTVLYLGDNQLPVIPLELFSLINLEHLVLDSTQLATLPPQIAYLKNLRILLLNENNLFNLPPELSQLTQLSSLDLENNPLTSPPPEIIKQGIQPVLAFLREQLQGCRQQWLSKLVVVGEGGVGKTSLLHALNGKPFVEGLETTHGIQIETLKLLHPNEEHVTMQLNAWDFGGQEIYHATHQFFLTNRSLFILVWNARHGYEQGKIYYWLDQIQARAPQSPVLVVATHLDERDADLPKEELQAKYPQIEGFYELSNKSGIGIEEICKALTNEAAKLPLMGQKWPTNWLNAAETIRKREEKHITPRQLCEIMEAENVSSKEVLARWLHELGDVLYFADDDELNDLVILKPQWVTEYISIVLESEEVIEKDGIFTRELERQLWSDLDPEMQDHFLRLMEKFDLSYRTLENREISLVVERLPLDPPEYEELWESPKSNEPCREIALTYKLSTLPAGIPTWFIARTHRFTTHTHWRSGAIFGDDRENPKHLALVRTSAHDRCLKLTVRGPNPHNFFTLLKDGIEVTLDRFPGLKIERMMPCPGHDGEACEYEFNYAHLQKAIEKNPPIQDIQCPVAFEMVSVPGLLFGLHWNTQDAVLERIDTLKSTITTQHAELSKEHAEMFEELQSLRELTQRQFLNIFRREQSKIESECPNVFVLRPYHSTKWKKTLFGKTLYLKLYCQQPGCWHPTEEGGLYEIKQSAEWFQTVAPYVQKLVGVLKYIAPLVGPWMAMSLPEYEKLLKNELKLMTELVKKLPEGEGNRELALAKSVGDDTFQERVSGAALRALRELLEEKDPNHDWGGLKKILTPEGHYLWLCEHHAKEYAI